MRWAIIALALSGCHLVFDSTVRESSEDEDLDGVINVEDNCPGIGNPDQADFDNDGVGDVCDPSSDRIDTIIHRSFFNGDDDVLWPLPEGWKQQNGALVAREPAMVQAFLEQTLPGRVNVVEVGFEMIAWTPAPNDAVGVRVDGPSGPLCVVNEPETGVELVLTTDAAGSNSNHQLLGEVPFDTRLVLRVSIEHATGHVECSFGATEPRTLDREPLAPGPVGLIIQNAQARITHVLVYASDD